MAKTKLFSGLWECPECGQEYELERAKEEDTVCDDCGIPLELADEEEEESEAEEEGEGEQDGPDDE